MPRHRVPPCLALIFAGCAAAAFPPAPPSPPAPAQPPPAPAQPPPGPTAPAAPAAPAATTVTTATPCFPDRPPLVASELYRTFEKHTWWGSSQDEAGAPPAERFGTCTVHAGKITAADGAVIAELGCGVQIFTRGIRDDLGLELGARGTDVLARWTAPHGPMVCLANGPAQARCRFDRADGSDTDFTTYVVAGDVGAEPLIGPAAERWFASRELIEIWHSVWCH